MLLPLKSTKLCQISRRAVFCAFTLKKHKTLQFFLQSRFRAFCRKKGTRLCIIFCGAVFRAFFSEKRAQDSARLHGAGHPGLSPDQGSRGLGGTQNRQISAIFAFPVCFSLAGAHGKSQDQKVATLQHSRPLIFPTFEASRSIILIYRSHP